MMSLSLQVVSVRPAVRLVTRIYSHLTDALFDCFTTLIARSFCYGLAIYNDRFLVASLFRCLMIPPKAKRRTVLGSGRVNQLIRYYTRKRRKESN